MADKGARMTERLEGLIVRAQSGFFIVETAAGLFTCQLRGRLKQEKRDTDIAALGDRVEILPQADGNGSIEEVRPRVRVLSRRAKSGGGRRDAGPQHDREQVLVANPDQAVFVFACADPAPHLRMLDRFLVAAERAGIPAAVCANKSDLVEPGRGEEIFGMYRGIGYPLLFTSARTGDGIPALRDFLSGNINVFSGPSGTGKSSLLNAIQPGLELRVSHISDFHQKGRHTTVAPELVPLAAGGYVADTPGLRAIAFWDISPEELDAYFPEIRQIGRAHV
jgi:ribosome biogenesis GTPase